jgi:hypothetical protein
VTPQELNENPPSSNDAAPPNQANDPDQEDEQDKNQDANNDKGGLCKMKMEMINRSQDHHHPTPKRLTNCSM